MPLLTGSDYARGLRLKSRATKQPIDLTGFALELVIKARRGDAAALVTLTSGVGLEVANPADGTVAMTLTAEQTTLVAAGERVWGLYRTDGGRRLALASGRMVVREGV